MTTIDPSAALATEHIRELQESARGFRLAALARCCQPATWRRLADRMAAVTHRLGTTLRTSTLAPADNYCSCA